MTNSRKSKLESGLQRRLFEKRGYYRKVFRKICAELKANESVVENLDMFLVEVNSGKVKLQNAQLESNIKLLFKLEQDVKSLEQKISDLEQNSNNLEEKGLL